MNNHHFIENNTFFRICPSSFKDNLSTKINFTKMLVFFTQL